MVDDEITVLKMSSHMLEGMGHRVYQAKNGSEAVKIYKSLRNEIDFVILDMIMPVKDGKQTFRALKEINADVRVLLSSGFSINDEAQTLLEEGALGFIQKPFRLEEIQAKIHEVLSEK